MWRRVDWYESENIMEKLAVSMFKEDKSVLLQKGLLLLSVMWRRVVWEIIPTLPTY
jgi:hypothetical protein